MCKNRRRDGDDRNMKTISVYISCDRGNSFRGNSAINKEYL